MLKEIKQRLLNFERENLHRIRKPFTKHHKMPVHIFADQRELINFCGNDYLNLSMHPSALAACKKTVDIYGIGSGASPNVTGYSQIHRECEIAFAQFLNCDRALLFSSGYLANIGTITALANRDDHIFADKYNHASLWDAIRLSGAKLHRYPHATLPHMNTPIDAMKFLITDAVFSMEGTIADLPALAQTAQNHQALLIIDDAHGVGILGKNGAGTCAHFQLTPDDVPLMICPLGKAFGSMGGIVAGQSVLIETVAQFARSYRYSTALPPAIAATLLTNLEIIQQETWRQEKLFHNVQYFKKIAQERNLVFSSSDMPIQSLIIGDVVKTLALSECLLQKGFYVTAIRPPTVPKNTARLRITLSCAHTEQQITALLDVLAHELLS